ncbi:serine/threonine-protein kinase [Aequorivita xiaoshiensis]|uniref:non-specific serine/threonine protein kinase n=1 Tax=Aequorivita xiaoshiensis TaxID=2874476 RepID=A0A9X1QYZ7_9FLAO|nr:serine/threonine-protein kinase [Aequorivita xiaoshiensis]MCG2430428.1 serine/threonine protein kinase [Aequorivita xiaoshiensis]
MSILGSQYDVIQKLGEGGMGVVYLARDTMIQRLVAIKQLHRDGGSEEESLGERFQAEALALAKLNHPNITHLYSFIPKEDTYWMIMEYVEGKTLEDWLKIHQKITHQLAASIAVQILDGLEHAHRKGIIHRDIKPANVMINEDGEVKIMDFGIARMRNAQRITSHGKSVGTLEYMAPEQIQGHEGDERIDVYAVGNILYEMLSGSTPFQSDTDYRLMKDKLEKRAESIIQYNSTVPVSFEKIIFKALQCNPNKRYKSAMEMKIAIEKNLGSSLLDQSTLTDVLQASQVFTEPQKGSEIISVNKIFARAKSISGQFKVPKATKVHNSLLLLGVSILFCAILLIWGGGTSKEIVHEKTPVASEVTWTEPENSPQEVVLNQTSSEFEESPNEMYKRIINNTEVIPEAKEEIKKDISQPTNSKPSNQPKKKSEPKPSIIPEKTVKKEDNVKKPVVPNTPVKVPAGKIISITLKEDLSSEEKERDGKQIQLICNEDVVAENRVIIKKGAEVIGKIVDVVESTHSRKKALIGFVIQYVIAVDGSKVKLKSKRYRLYADTQGIPVTYKTGETFEAKLRGGKVR